MACGTGKTLVGLWTSEELGSRMILTEPSLALVAQNL
jgi:predicted helicase